MSCGLKDDVDKVGVVESSTSSRRAPHWPGLQQVADPPANSEAEAAYRQERRVGEKLFSLGRGKPLPIPLPIRIIKLTKRFYFASSPKGRG